MPSSLLTWDFPYPSQRMPVLARNVVATSQPLAAQAGLSMMTRGGNAIDAAIAAAVTLTVVEPTSNGIGGDAFALVWATGCLHGLNASGRTPAAISPEHFAGAPRMPESGWGPVTVPGAVSAWAALHERFGSLPLEDLFEPAIRYATDGFLVAPQTAAAWAAAQRTFAPGGPGRRDFAPWQATFAPGGAAPRPGEVFACPDQARTLEEIARTRGESFYRGRLAELIAASAREGGGMLTRDDLAAHQPEWARPISTEKCGKRIWEMPPNSQGIAALQMLGIARHFDLASMDPDSADSLHVQIEAMKLAFADAHRFLADPPWMDVDPVSLIDEAYLEQRAALIDPQRARDCGHGRPKSGGTVYLATADDRGNMVSFIQSNYTGFGSGIVIPGTGIAMQNRGACFTLQPGHPNEVAGGKRPYHTIIPGFVTDGDAALMAFGIMGGYMQPQAHGQFIIRLLDHGQNPQAALDAPRWRVAEGLKVDLEPGFSPDTCDALRARGHDVTVSETRTVGHGGGQAICRLAEGYLAASDGRRDGQAAGS